MTGIGKSRRRRWLWGLLAVVLALAAAPVAWRYRPLGPFERPYVGDWVMRDDGPRGEIGEELTLLRTRRYIRRNHSFTPPAEHSGTWEARLDSLVLKPDVPFWMSDRFRWLSGMTGPRFNRSWTLDPSGLTLIPEIALLEGEWTRAVGEPRENPSPATNGRHIPRADDHVDAEGPSTDKR